MGDVPVFVGGVGRSGTTITSRLIGSHANWSRLPLEAMFHADVRGLPGWIDGSIDDEQFREAMLGFFFRHPGPNRDYGIHRIMGSDDLVPLVDKLLQSADRALAAGQFIEDIFSGAVEPGTSWVEDTPANARHAVMLSSVLPSAKFVHLVRDGRDVAVSITDKHWGPDNHDDALEYWGVRLRRIAVELSQLPPERVHTVSFESLFSVDRDDVVARLFAFLNVPVTDAVETFVTTTMTRDRARIGRWKRDVPPQMHDGLVARHHELAQRAGFVVTSDGLARLEVGSR